MRRSWLLCSLLLAVPAVAEDRWILVSGAVGTFRTDARVLNPSYDKDIQVTARFLTAVNPPQGNNGAVSGAGTTFTVPKRSMHILNDVTAVLFNVTSGLGAILFTSTDPFEVTSRIYSQQASGTLGQFGPGLAPSQAKTKGAVLQMKASGARGQTGTFRTNMGVVNMTNAETVVTWRLYDKNNALAATGTTTIPPYGVTPPLAMTDARFFQSIPAGTDVSDAWVSYSSTNPVFVYASVLDNGTEDQTFVPAVDDVGVAPLQPPPQTATHTFEVSLEDFSITFSPAPDNIRVGDSVLLKIRRAEGSHGFQVSDPDFRPVVPATTPIGNSAVERSFTVTVPGVYQYFCTNAACGAGHNQMFGSFTVPGATGPGPGPGY